jgi:hypothetical protein
MSDTRSNAEGGESSSRAITHTKAAERQQPRTPIIDDEDICVPSLLAKHHALKRETSYFNDTVASKAKQEPTKEFVPLDSRRNTGLVSESSSRKNSRKGSTSRTLPSNFGRQLNAGSRAKEIALEASHFELEFQENWETSSPECLAEEQRLGNGTDDNDNGNGIENERIDKPQVAGNGDGFSTLDRVIQTNHPSYRVLKVEHDIEAANSSLLKEIKSLKKENNKLEKTLARTMRNMKMQDDDFKSENKQLIWKCEDLKSRLDRNLAAPEELRLLRIGIENLQIGILSTEISPEDMEDPKVIFDDSKIVPELLKSIHVSIKDQINRCVDMSRAIQKENKTLKSDLELEKSAHETDVDKLQKELEELREEIQSNFVNRNAQLQQASRVEKRYEEELNEERKFHEYWKLRHEALETRVKRLYDRNLVQEHRNLKDRFGAVEVRAKGLEEDCQRWKQQAKAWEAECKQAEEGRIMALENIDQQAKAYGEELRSYIKQYYERLEGMEDSWQVERLLQEAESCNRRCELQKEDFERQRADLKRDFEKQLNAQKEEFEEQHNEKQRETKSEGKAEGGMEKLRTELAATGQRDRGSRNPRSMPAAQLTSTVKQAGKGTQSECKSGDAVQSQNQLESITSEDKPKKKGPSQTEGELIEKARMFRMGARYPPAQPGWSELEKQQAWERWGIANYLEQATEQDRDDAKEFGWLQDDLLLQDPYAVLEPLG